MNEKDDVKQNVNEVEVSVLMAEHPFKNEQTVKFYNRNFGNTPNSFIQPKPMYRDFLNAILTLLHFWDTHGDAPIYLACRGGIAFSLPDEGSWQKTTLLNYVLDCTQKALDFSKLDKYELLINRCGNFRLIYSGIAALASQVCLGFGESFVKQFNNDTLQASLAVLGNMPAVKNLRSRGQIEDVLKIYHIYSRPNRTYDNIYLYKSNINITEIAKTILDANLFSIRETIFRSAQPQNLPHHFGWGTSMQHQLKKIVEKAVSERTAFAAENQIEDLLSKNHAYIKEIEGLRRNSSKLESEKKILSKIVRAYEKNDLSAAKEAKKELKTFRNA
jgi:hypothetical protein